MNSNSKTYLHKDCEHYLRGCFIKTECCNKYYNCRVCHDENESHILDRKTIKIIKCKKCDTEQDISKKCINCELIFGFYYCDICNLLDYVNKDQYHCDKCGICRVNKKLMKHCEKCNLCHSKNIQIKCIDSVDNECPICMDNLFNSIAPSIYLQCGHRIHHNCLIEYSKADYRCPICRKAFCDTINIFNEIELNIQINPMPEQYQKKINIICYECNEKSNNVDFHFIGMKCMHCGGFNTSEI